VQEDCQHWTGVGQSSSFLPSLTKLFGIAKTCSLHQISSDMSLTELLPVIRNLSAADKLRLIRHLAEQVDLEGEIAPLEHGRTYLVSTPNFAPGASEILQRELESSSEIK